MKDLEAEVLAVRSKQQAMNLVSWVGRDPSRFRQLIELFLYGDRRVAQLAAWIVGHCGERAPELVTPHLGKMLKKLKEPGIHPAVKRNVLRVLQFVEIPEILQGIAANLCFQYLSAIDEPIAVRTFAITVLAHIAKNQPDLLNEVKLVLRTMLPYATPAFLVRARRVLSDHAL